MCYRNLGIHHYACLLEEEMVEVLFLFYTYKEYRLLDPTIHTPSLVNLIN